MKSHRGSGGIVPIILHIELDGGQRSALRRVHFTSVIEPQYRRMCSKAGLDF